MNKGLKSCTSQLQYNVGNAFTTYINLNKEDANFHIVIPLIITNGESQINTKLIFNQQDDNLCTMFNYGFKLNYYSKLTEYENMITIKNSDGSVDEYYQEEVEELFYNRILRTKIKRNFSNQYKYQLLDKVGNAYFYIDQDEYPRLIKYYSGEEYNILYNENGHLIISNNKDDKVIFITNDNGIVERVIYKYKEEDLIKIELQYSNYKICNIKYYQKNNDEFIEVSELKLILNYNVYELIDHSSKYKMKFIFNSELKEVTNVVEGYDNSYNDLYPTVINYYTNYSVVTNIYGQKQYYFFDNNQLPIYTIDYLGNMVCTHYSTSGKLLSLSSSIPVKTKLDNLLETDQLSAFINTNVSVEKISCTNELYNDILHDSLFKVTTLGYDNQTLEYEVNLEKLNDKNLVFVLWGRKLLNKSIDNNVSIDLYLNEHLEKSIILNNYMNDDMYNMLYFSLKPYQAYSKLKVEINILGENILELGGLQLINKDMGEIYTYDIYGNLIEAISKSSYIKYEYDENNRLISNFKNNIDQTNIEYDEQNRVVSTNSSNIRKVTNTYVTDNSKNISSSTISNYNETQNYNTNYVYDSDNRYLKEIYSDLKSNRKFGYDALGKIIEVTNFEEVKTNYKYNKNNIEEVCISKNDVNTSLKYNYDDRKRVNSILLSNGTKYTFQYNSFGFIEKMFLNNVLLTSFEYDIYGNIITKKDNATGNGYRYVYDSNGLLINVYKIANNGTETLKYQYLYDQRNNLIEILNKNNISLKKYIYNNDDELIKEIDSNVTVEYIYDRFGDFNSSCITKNNEQTYTLYNYNKELSSSRLECMLDSFKKYSYVTSYSTTNNLIKGNQVLSAINRRNNTKMESLDKSELIPCIKVDNENCLMYKVECDNYYFEDSGCIKFYFKPSNVSTKQYIFSCKSNSTSCFIGAYIENSKLYIELIDNQNEQIDPYEVSNIDELNNMLFNVIPNEWNYFAISYETRTDGPIGSDTFKFTLRCNNNYFTKNLSHPRPVIEFTNYPEYNIGHKFNGESISDCFSGKIALLNVTCRKSENENEIRDYFNVCNEVVMNDLLTTTEEQINYNSEITFKFDQSTLEDYKIFPLINNLNSLTSDIPIKYIKKNMPNKVESKEFKYNEENGRCSYLADGATLIYDLNLNDIGTIMFRAYTTYTNSKQYFFEGLNTNGKNIALYRNENNKLCVIYKGSVKVTNLTFTNNTWHFVSLSFYKPEVTSGYYNKNYVYVRVILDEQEYTSSFYNPLDIDKFIFSIGKNYTEVTNKNNNSNVQYYPLYGQIEMLCSIDAYCEVNTIKNFSKKLLGQIKITKYDNLGRIISYDITEQGLEERNIIMSYQENEQENNSDTVLKEYTETEIIGNNKFIKTVLLDDEYKAKENKIIIRDLAGSLIYEEIHLYSYNERGFLICENASYLDMNDPNITDEQKLHPPVYTTSYEYDSNGNIEKIISDKTFLNKIYFYDSNVKDKLTEIREFQDIEDFEDFYTSYNVNYHNLNTLYITNYKNNTFTYENEKVIQHVSNGRVFYYTYDEFGRRIKKANYMGIGTEYIYNNDLLMTEINRDYRFDFLYDSNGKLYGFIKDNTDTYYYVRDYLNNIIAITTKNGEIVVQYTYTAYGQNLGVTGRLASTIGYQNPFRYKGYYYDVETGLFWLSSRYYSPELCRFISPDDVEYLDPESVNGLNLYCYCKNNPIMYVDPSGHFTLLTLGISLGFALLFEVIEDVKTDGKLGGDKDGWDYLGATVSGILGGMSGVAGFVLGIYGDLFDAAISGDLAEDGWKVTLQSMVASTLLSFGIESAVKGVFDFKQIRKLTSDADANKKLVKSLGATFSFTKNGKSKKAFVDSIKSTNWNRKKYTSQVFKEFGSSLYSLFF